MPTELPLKDLLIVENQNFLINDGDEEEGIAIALVDVVSIHVWQNDEIEPACATSWSEGYFAWVLSNVRPVKQQLGV